MKSRVTQHPLKVSRTFSFYADGEISLARSSHLTIDIDIHPLDERHRTTGSLPPSNG